MSPVYRVAVLGFNLTERIVLGSIFGMSEKRTPGFVRLEDETEKPDIFLVDADDASAMTALMQCNRGRAVPVVLVGRNDFGTGWPRLPRPLQWARLFAAFDAAIARGTSGSAPGGADTSRGQGATALLRGSPPGGGTSPRAEPRADDGRTDGTSDPVLVVSAHAGIREAVRRNLGLFHLQSESARSSAEALGMLEIRRYACIFSAVSAPGIDGISLCRLVKSGRRDRAVPVVLLATRESRLDGIKVRMAGGDAYIASPSDDDQLREVIVRYLPGNSPL
jgi:CheY-like chemotaxis protein